MAHEGRTRSITHHSSSHAHHSGAVRLQVGRQQRPGAERLCGGAQPAGGHTAEREALRADDVGGRRAAGPVSVFHPEPVWCAVRPAAAPRRPRRRVLPPVCGIASYLAASGRHVSTWVTQGAQAGREPCQAVCKRAEAGPGASEVRVLPCRVCVLLPCSPTARAGVPKWVAEAERPVRESGLPYTMLRPSRLTLTLTPKS